MEELIPIAVSALLNLVGNSAQSAQNRSDFRYTHNMTNIPAQVNEMRDAGLNPALAYGQISSPQGQSLGNYQFDLTKGLRDLSSSRQARSEAEYRDAETAVLKAQAQYIIQKTKNEALMSDFDLIHQPERYGLEIQSKGLVNAGLDLQNQGYQIENHGKIIDNEIKTIVRDIEEFNRQMKQIDVSRHKDYVDAEIKRLVSSTNLMLREAWALGQKVPYEVSTLQETADKLRQEIFEMQKTGEVTRENIMKLNTFQDLENAYKAWLSRDPRVRSMIENAHTHFANEIVNLFITPSY